MWIGYSWHCLLLWTDICLGSQVLVSCLNSSHLTLLCPFSVTILPLEMRQGFLNRGLCSGKTLWPAPREDLQKDVGWEQEDQVGWRGKKTRRPSQIKAEDHLGGSWGKEPPLFPRWPYFLPLFGLFSFCLPVLSELQGFFPGVWVGEY